MGIRFISTWRVIFFYFEKCKAGEIIEFSGYSGRFNLILGITGHP